MRIGIAGALSVWLMWGVATPVYATALQVAPVLVDVPAPGAASKLTLKNNGSEQLKAQIRIFKWVQRNGKDELIPTRDVVASPPLVKISPNGSNIVRIVRVSKNPIKGEEAYRLIVDQLPDRKKSSGIAVKLQMRYSIPVFFGTNSSAEPKLAWTVKANGSNLIVQNTGPRRVRVSELTIKNARGERIGSKNGLVGYVLSNSMASFKIGMAKKAKKGSQVLITANGQNQQISIKSRVQ